MSTVMPTLASSMVTTAAKRPRPAHRSSDQKYGSAHWRICLKVALVDDMGCFVRHSAKSGRLR